MRILGHGFAIKSYPQAFFAEFIEAVWSDVPHFFVPDVGRGWRIQLMMLTMFDTKIVWGLMLIVRFSRRLMQILIGSSLSVYKAAA